MSPSPTSTDGLVRVPSCWMHVQKWETTTEEEGQRGIHRYIFTIFIKWELPTQPLLTPLTLNGPCSLTLASDSPIVCPPKKKTWTATQSTSHRLPVPRVDNPSTSPRSGEASTDIRRRIGTTDKRVPFLHRSGETAIALMTSWGVTVRPQIRTVHETCGCGSSSQSSWRSLPQENTELIHPAHHFKIPREIDKIALHTLRHCFHCHDALKQFPRDPRNLLFNATWPQVPPLPLPSCTRFPWRGTPHLYFPLVQCTRVNLSPLGKKKKTDFLAQLHTFHLYVCTLCAVELLTAAIPAAMISWLLDAVDALALLRVQSAWIDHLPHRPRTWTRIWCIHSKKVVRSSHPNANL